MEILAWICAIFRTEKSNDDVVLEVANDILRLLPVSIEDYTDVRESHGGQIQNIPRPSLKDILFKEAPELKDKEKERSKGNCLIINL